MVHSGLIGCFFYNIRLEYIGRPLNTGTDRQGVQGQWSGDKMRTGKKIKITKNYVIQLNNINYRFLNLFNIICKTY